MSSCADSNDADHKCDTCGKDNITGHSYGEWQSDAEKHWKACACGATNEVASHADEATKDHKCDTCGYVMSSCDDQAGDNNHSCDICNKPNVSTHTPGEVSHENITQPNCYKDGSHDEVTYCTECGTQTSRVKVTDPATGNHIYGTVGYTWSDDNATCTASHTCTTAGCGHVQTANATVSAEQTKDPTCAVNGETTYTAIFQEDWATKQTVKLADIPATGNHVYVAGKYIWSDDNSGCSVVAKGSLGTFLYEERSPSTVSENCIFWIGMKSSPM